jgi:hypothetical protein
MKRINMVDVNIVERAVRAEADVERAVRAEADVERAVKAEAVDVVNY